jgi:hypothetical protein
VTRAEFAARLKATYPAYAGMADDDLVDRTVAKYPQYASQIDDLQPSDNAHPQQNFNAAHRRTDGLPGSALPPSFGAEPTVGERIKSGAGNLVSGLGDLASSVVVGVPEAAGNIVSAIPRAGYAAIDALQHGGSAGDAFEAAKNVQPYRGATTAMSKAATNLGHATTEAMGGVRPGIDTDVQDAAARLAPVVAGVLAGGRSVKTGATSRAAQAVAFYEPKIAAAATDAEKAALTAEMQRTVSGLAEVAPKTPTDVASGATATAPISRASGPTSDASNEPVSTTQEPPIAPQGPNGAQIGPSNADIQALTDQAGRAQAEAVPRPADTTAASIRAGIDRMQNTNPDVPGLSGPAKLEGITVTPEHLEGAADGHLVAENPDGSLVRMDPEEFRRLSREEPQPQSAAVADLSRAEADLPNSQAGGEPNARNAEVAPPESGLGQDQTGGNTQAPQVGRLPPTQNQIDFDNYLDTTDANGNPIAPQPAVEPNAAPSGEPASAPSKQPLTDWMLGSGEEAYPGIKDDAAYAENTFRGSEPAAAPPKEADLTPRGPGEAPVQQNPQAPKIRRSTMGGFYDRAVPQIVDAIEKQGDAGAETASKMRAAQMFSDQFTAPAVADLKAATKGMTDAQINQVGDIVEKFSQGGMPAGVDPKVAAAVDIIRRDVGRIKDLALGHVSDFTPLEDYLPHIGKPPEDMPASVQNLVNRAGHESGNLTRQRGQNSVRPEGQDLLNAIQSYYRGASRYIGELRAFNVGDRPGLDAALSTLADKATANGYDGDLIQQYASKAMGGGQTDDRVAAKIADSVISAQSMTKPFFAPIRHFQQIRNDLATFGFGNTLRGVVDTMGQKAGLSPDGSRAVLESGAVVRDAARDMMQMSSQGGVAGALRKGAEWMNTPVRLVDQVKAQVTANAAAHHFTELADLAQGNSVPLARRIGGELRSTPVVQQAARDTLARAGVDVANLADKNAYAQGMRNYMWQATQDTQKSMSKLGSPAFSMTPWGRVLYLFNRPTAFGTDFALQRVLKPAAAGDLGPLVRYTVGSALGYGSTEAAVHALKGRSDPVLDAMHGNDVPVGEALRYGGEAVMPHGYATQNPRATPMPWGENYPGSIPSAIGQALQVAGERVPEHLGGYGAMFNDYKALADAMRKEEPGRLMSIVPATKLVQPLYNKITGGSDSERLAQAMSSP